MSRIGKKPIAIPSGVTVSLAGDLLTVKGPKGELNRIIHPLVKVTTTPEFVQIDVANKEEKKSNALWGTFGSHVRNMIQGVTVGFQKQLEVNGVGYRVAMQGAALKLEVGFSHPVMYNLPKGVTATVEKNLITLQGADKELVGQTAAEVRNIRKPEPYKGKGIKYIDETIRRKAGKTAKTA
ncbi:MAG: 50S ribosomal protein L6 [Candidatus Magasanikbacteria bacterium RIFCSPHIGHO2_02_FULL_47_14]|uniref:Large ribosomal subunit protein uL6 n=1 Tax=Candidatus Magasanikbacteria bacterium RIFCSPHIGHO2_02_FULL_47_14 TaxID=1798680 RepID=A0A1F6LYY5_9BACT|nr:MAG: 50S ribosomal protein L6 [Candidatus Magasanikbacteria bacterium RIFCSPHIGHO2_02_FULL_47_14]